MTIKVTFDHKKLSFAYDAATPDEAWRIHREILEAAPEDGTSTRRDRRKPKDTDDTDFPTVNDVPTVPEGNLPEETQPVAQQSAGVPAKLEGKREVKRHAAQLNETLNSLIDKLIVVVPDFHGKDHYTVSMELFKKEQASMMVSELQAAIDTTKGALAVFAGANEEAQAFLEMAGLIDSATNLDELAANRNSFTKAKILSRNQRLFNEARTLYDNKKAVLTAAEAVAFAS